MTQLGKGGYGVVIRQNGKAVKTVKKISHHIHELSALYLLRDSTRFVHAISADLIQHKTTMELYDFNFREWIKKNGINNPRTRPTVLRILNSILKGLIELHDMGLIHGDIKPSNVLLKKISPDKIKAVLGDCGFVGIPEYAKITRTTRTYRDPYPKGDLGHDIYSVGVILLEIFGSYRMPGKKRMRGQLDQIETSTPADEAAKLDIAEKVYKLYIDKTKENVSDKNMRKLILSCFSRDRKSRPTIRQIYSTINNGNDIDIKLRRYPNNTYEQNKYKEILNEFNDVSTKLKLNHTTPSFKALVYFLESNNIKTKKFRLHLYSLLVINSSIFRPKSNYSVKMAGKDVEASKSKILNTISSMLNSNNFIDLLYRTE